MTLAEKKKLFNKWAYGLFIHYGVYSALGRGEWAMFYERLNPEDYFREALPGFNPKKGCAREWVELAVRGNMKYAVLTTRHHEGYFIGDEILRDFTEACREHGLGIGFYYSIADWSDPDYWAGPGSPESWERFVQKTHRQIREIMTGYGRIDYLFYDGCPPPDKWRLHELHREIRAIQPEMLISRCGEDTDLKSCEGHANGDPNNIWESCYTLNDSWGYNRFDRCWKTPHQIASMFSDNRHNGGNLLLNVGPEADGTVQAEEVKIIETVGEWIRKNEEALFDIVPHPFDYFDKEITTAHDNLVYMRLTREHGPERRRIGGIGNKVRKITFLESGKNVDFLQKDDVVILTGLTPPENPELPRMIRIELDGLPVGIRNPKMPDCIVKVTGE